MKKRKIVLTGLIIILLSLFVGCSKLDVGTSVMNELSEYSYTYEDGSVLKEEKLIGKWVSKEGQVFDFRKDKTLVIYKDESKKEKLEAGTFSLVAFERTKIYEKNKDKGFTKEEMKTPVVEFSTMDIQYDEKNTGKIPFNTTPFLITSFDGKGMVMVNLDTSVEYILTKSSN